MYDKCIQEFIAKQIAQTVEGATVDPRLQAELFDVSGKLQTELKRAAARIAKDKPSTEMGIKASEIEAVDELMEDVLYRRLRLINNATALADATKYINTPVPGYTRSGKLAKYLNELPDSAENMFIRTLNSDPTLTKFVADFRSKYPWLQDSMDPDEAAQILLAMEGRKGVEAEYVKFAEALTKVKNEQLAYLRGMGVNVKQLEYHSLPLLQSGYKVAQMGRDKWVKYMDANFKHVDGIEGPEKIALLNKRFDEYVSGQSEPEGSSFLFDMNSSMNRQRHWLPNSPDVAVRTIMDLGTHGSVYHAMLNQLRTLVLEGEIVRKLGSTPEATYKRLKNMASKADAIDAYEGKTTRFQTINNSLGLDNLFDQVLGRTAAVVPPTGGMAKLQEFSATFNNITNAISLTKSTVSAIGDLKNMSLLAKRFGDSYVAVFGEFTKNLDKDLARAILYSGEEIFAGIKSANRFGELEGLGKASHAAAAAANMTSRMTFLQKMTKVTQDISARYTNRKLAEMIQNVNFTQLDNKTFNFMNLHGVSEKDFLALKSAISPEGYIDPRKLSREVEAKLWAIISFENRAAVAMPDMDIKANIMRGGQKSNTLLYPVVKTLTSIKGFLFSNFIKQTRTVLTHPLLEGNRVGYFAQSAALALIFGGLTVQAHEIIAGRDLMDPTSIDFWLRTVAAGSLGFGAEFLMAEAVRLKNEGKGFKDMGELLTPSFPALAVYGKMLGFSFNTFAAAVTGDIDALRETIAEGVDKGFDNVPGNPWFLHAAERALFVKQLAYWISDDYRRKDEERIRRRERETGQGEWWNGQGEIRMPEIAEDRN